MREYFYLVSSLVTLSPDVKPLCTSDSFLELCRGQISGAEWNILAATKLIDDGTLKIDSDSTEVLRQYWSWDGNLRNLLLEVLTADGSGAKYKRHEEGFLLERARSSGKLRRFAFVLLKARTGPASGLQERH